MISEEERKRIADKIIEKEKEKHGISGWYDKHEFLAQILIGIGAMTFVGIIVFIFYLIDLFFGW